MCISQAMGSARLAYGAYGLCNGWRKGDGECFDVRSEAGCRGSVSRLLMISD